MCSVLFYIPSAIAGLPMFGFGLLLAAWAVGSVVWLAWLIRRQGLNADTRGYVPILLLVGAVIAWVLPALCETTLDGRPLGLPIRGYGVMMLAAVVAGTALAVRRARRIGWGPDLVFSLVFWMIVPGILGARVFYVTEYWRDYWAIYTSPDGGLRPFLGNIVNLARGGLVVYGSFFGGMVGLLLFVRRHRLPLLAVCDLIAPSMMLGLAIGRIGCLLNGCCFGMVCQHDWAVTFPAGSPPYLAQVQRGQMYGFLLSGHPKSPPRVQAVVPGSPAERAGLRANDFLLAVNEQKLPVGRDNEPTGAAHAAVERAFYERQPLQLQIEGRPAIVIPAIQPLPRRSLAVQPTQLLSTIDALLLCLLLLAYDPFRRRDGELFALTLSIYPVTRFFIESLRSDEAAVFGTRMSISQNVSIALLIAAAALWFYILRSGRRSEQPRPSNRATAA